MFLRMLSYYISWHMKQTLAPILFHDHDKTGAAAKRTNPVAAAQRSDTALAKAARKHTQDDTPVHSFTSLLADLATICSNQIQPANDTPAFTMLTTPPSNACSLKTLFPFDRIRVGGTTRRDRLISGHLRSMAQATHSHFRHRGLAWHSCGAARIENHSNQSSGSDYCAVRMTNACNIGINIDTSAAPDYDVLLV